MNRQRRGGSSGARRPAPEHTHTLWGLPVPGELAQLPGPNQPSKETAVKWLVVIRTYGIKHVEDRGLYLDDRCMMSLREFSCWSPSRRGDRLLPGYSAVEEHETCYAQARADGLGRVPMGCDVVLHSGRGPLTRW